MKKLSILLVVMLGAWLIIPAVHAENSEFEEGEQWAQENDVSDIAYDEGDPNNALADNDSEPFDEGVRAYSENQV